MIYQIDKAVDGMYGGTTREGVHEVIEKAIGLVTFFVVCPPELDLTQLYHTSPFDSGAWLALDKACNGWRKSKTTTWQDVPVLKFLGTFDRLTEYNGDPKCHHYEIVCLKDCGTFLNGIWKSK